MKRQDEIWAADEQKSEFLSCTNSRKQNFTSLFFTRSCLLFISSSPPPPHPPLLSAPAPAGWWRMAGPHWRSRRCPGRGGRWPRAAAGPSRSPGPPQTPARSSWSWTGRPRCSAGWGWVRSGSPSHCNTHTEVHTYNSAAQTLRSFNGLETDTHTHILPPCSPLAVSHLHGLQFGVGSSVETLHLLLLQPLQQTDGVLVDSASLRQHQWSRSIVVTAGQTTDVNMDTRLSVVSLLGRGWTYFISVINPMGGEQAAAKTCG